MQEKEDFSNYSDEELLNILREEEALVVRYNLFQLAMKILINSLYGALAEKSFRFYDVRLAEAITSTGQVMIKYGEMMINKFISSIIVKVKDNVLLIDTDSLYTSFDDIIKHYSISDEEQIEFLDKQVRDEVRPFLKESFDRMNDFINGTENFMDMKREKIATSMIIRAKKNYIIDVADNEGIRYTHPKLSMTGIEAVKSIVPQRVKEMLMPSYEIFLRGTEKEIQEHVKKSIHHFLEAPLGDIAPSSGISKPVQMLPKGTPSHIKAAIAFNKYIKEKKFTHIKPIKIGDKVRIVHLKENNPYGNDRIVYDPEIPEKDFPLEKWVNRKKMLVNQVIKPLQTFAVHRNWNIIQEAKEKFKGLKLKKKK